MQICPKYAQKFLTGKFETPPSTPLGVQITIFFRLKSKYIHISELSESYM